MSTPHKTGRGFLIGVLSVLLAVILLLPACSDDPILGPEKDDDSDGGGSYSSIKRLAPAGSTYAEPRSLNPERF